MSKCDINNENNNNYYNSNQEREKTKDNFPRFLEARSLHREITAASPPILGTKTDKKRPRGYCMQRAPEGDAQSNLFLKLD